MTEAMQQAGAAQAVAPLRLSRVLHARRELVFKAFSSAEHVQRWFAPETYSVPSATVEFRVGGAFDVCMRSPGGETHWTCGRFLEVTPERRLVIEMLVADSAGAPLFKALTQIDLADVLGGVRVDVTQTYELVDAARAAPMVGGASAGWSSTLTKLEREAIRLQGGAETGARSVVHATFHLERTYEASAPRVWKALTEPAAKAKWFGGSPGAFELVERTMDVRVGGVERLKGRWQGGVVSTFEAVYHDVAPNERLVYAYVMWLDEKKISVSLATLQLKAAGAGKTTLMLTEQGAFLDGYDDAGSREEGTRQLLEALAGALAD